MKKVNYLKDCKNILHIGGHNGEEGKDYIKNNLKFTFVEPIPFLADQIRRKGYPVIQVAVSNFNGVADFLITENTLCSSLKEMKRVPAKKVIKVKVVKLKEIQEGFDGLVIDAQGETYNILKSGDLNFKVIICEGSYIPRYENEVGLDKIEKYLQNNYFERVGQIIHPDKNIVDVIYKSKL